MDANSLCFLSATLKRRGIGVCTLANIALQFLPGALCSILWYQAVVRDEKPSRGCFRPLPLKPYNSARAPKAEDNCRNWWICAQPNACGESK
jgi:hypothetical protein